MQTKPYFQLMPPSNNPKRVLWLFAVVITTLMAIAVWGGLLSSCKSKPAQKPPAVEQRDTLRERLQREADATIDTVTVTKERTSSTQKPYENAAFDYDSLRSYLP